MCRKEVWKLLDHGWKRLCSGFLALTLVVGMLPPVTVAAEETETTEETEAPLPENVAVVQALIDALPTVDSVTAENYDAVQNAYDAYDALTDEEKALIQGVEKFEALFGWFNGQIATLETVDSGTVALPESPVTIGREAFHRCTALNQVYFWGAQGDRNAISTGSGNAPLSSAKWIYHFLLITGAQNLGDGLTAGQSTQLTATMKPANTVEKAKWILPEEYQQYATLSSSGKITAKNVTEKVMITVWAEVDGYGRGGMSFWIIPKATSLTIDQGTALTVDMHESTTLNLTATATPLDVSNDVTWSTSDKKIATVDETGKVIVTMKDDEDYATNKTHKVTLNMLTCGQDVSTTISFKVTQSALKLTLTPGKSYTVYLDVTAQNAATNVNPTQIKLTVKVQK